MWNPHSWVTGSLEWIEMASLHNKTHSDLHTNSTVEKGSTLFWCWTIDTFRYPDTHRELVCLKVRVGKFRECQAKRETNQVSVFELKSTARTQRSVEFSVIRHQRWDPLTLDMGLKIRYRISRRNKKRHMWVLKSKCTDM